MSSLSLLDDLQLRSGLHPVVSSGSLSFSLTPTRKMVLATCEKGGTWSDLEVRDFGPIPMSPAAGVLNYGQGVFEGMKARRTDTGRIVVFRPDMNASRINQGARRLCMPEVPPSLFFAALAAVVAENADFVPNPKDGTLYLRPLLIGSGPVLGVKAAPSYTFLIYASPVGPYFKPGASGSLDLKVRRDYHRAAPLGCGGVKAIGNYAPSILPAKEVKAAGFNEVIYVDAAEGRLLEEVGSANLFAVIDGAIHTPRLRGSILPGVTRRSVLELAARRGIEVFEDDITIEDLRRASEIFGTGTAAGIAPVGMIELPDGERLTFPGQEGPVSSGLTNGLIEIVQERGPDPDGWLVDVPGLIALARSAAE